MGRCRDDLPATPSIAAFAPTTLQRAIDRLGFVQADPIRATARRGSDAAYRVRGLSRRRVSSVALRTLGVEEDHFIQIRLPVAGGVALMTPPGGSTRTGPPAAARRVAALMDFVRDRGTCTDARPTSALRERNT